jgi:hypothetical protein
MNLQEQISRIQSMMGVINESDKRKYWLLRRLETPDVKDYIEDNISYLTIRSGCKYKKLNDPLWAVMEDLVNNVINFFFEELYDEDDQLEMDMFVWKVLEEKYGDIIKEQLDSIDCSNMDKV